MRVNFKVTETDDNGTRILFEKTGYDAKGDDFEAIKAKFNADMRHAFSEFTEHTTREYFIEPTKVN